jgi:cardiolipin synthase (CMP-forming)
LSHAVSALEVVLLAKLEGAPERDKQPRRCRAGRRRLLYETMTPRRALGTIPNLISVSRVALAAGFVASSATELRVGIIGVAAITDFLDGWIARRAHATSRWGAMIDPIADRFFVLTVVGTMLFTGMISTGAYFVLISRDLATAVGFIVAKIIPWLRGVTFRARVSGKVVTVLQLLTLVSVLVAPITTPWLLGLVGVASVLSIADYTLALWRARAQ